MCGRFTYRFKWQQLSQLMELLSWTDAQLEPRFNVAPTQTAPVVRERDDGGREGTMLRWGLVPSWAEGLAVGARSFNARSETVADKPTFRESFRHRRCLVPVSGFYEWRVLREGKQRFYVTRPDGQPFALAGLWDRWNGPEGRQGAVEASGRVETFTVLTTTPNALMRPLHDRMPVIVRPEDVGAWIGQEPLPAGEAARLFEPRDDAGLEAFPVAALVSNARNEEQELTARVPEVDPNAGFLF